MWYTTLSIQELTSVVPKMFLISPVNLKVPEMLQLQLKVIAVFI